MVRSFVGDERSRVASEFDITTEHSDRKGTVKMTPVINPNDPSQVGAGFPLSVLDSHFPKASRSHSEE